MLEETPGHYGEIAVGLSQPCAPYYEDSGVTLYHADAREIPLASGSVHCCVTSPPYWGLRQYGVDGEIGMEPTVGEYIENMLAVTRGVWRVLRDDGTLWMVLGDCYWGGKGRSSYAYVIANPDRETIQKPHQNVGGMGLTRPTDRRDQGFKAKTAVGLPWMVTFALQKDGWIVRSPIIWNKPHPKPESMRDRPTISYEFIFMLTKQGRYYYDQYAVREPVDGARQGQYEGLDSGNFDGANLRNVWTIPQQHRPHAHYATFPDEIPRRCILLGTSNMGVCSGCGAPWVRVVEKSRQQKGERTKYRTKEWKASCDCGDDPVPATVIDPFVGSGTTCVVARDLGRRGIGMDLNEEYLEISKNRMVDSVTEDADLQQDVYQSQLL